MTLFVGGQDVTLNERPACLAPRALHKPLTAVEDQGKKQMTTASLPPLCFLRVGAFQDGGPEHCLTPLPGDFSHLSATGDQYGNFSQGQLESGIWQN